MFLGNLGSGSGFFHKFYLVEFLQTEGQNRVNQKSLHKAIGDNVWDLGKVGDFGDIFQSFTGNFLGDLARKIFKLISG